MRTNTRDQCSTCDNESETESEFYAYLKKNDLEARKLEASKLRIETKKARKANKNNTQKEKREKKKKSQLEVKKGARNKKRNTNKKTKKIMKKKKKPKNLLRKKILETIHMIEMRDKTESLFRKTELNGTSASQQSFGATCNATNSQALIPSGSIVLPIVIKQEFHAPNNCSTNNDEESNSDSSVELLGEYRPAKRRKLHSSKKSGSSRACFKNLGSELLRDVSLNPPKINVPAEKIKDENDVEVTSCLRSKVQSDSFLPFPPCTFTYSYQETDNKAFQVPSVNVSCPSTSSPLLANPLGAGSNFNPQILVSKGLFPKPIGVNSVNSSPTVEDQSLVHQIQKCIRENVRSSIENFFLKRNISEITNIPQGIPSRSATSTEVSCEETGCDPKNYISKNVSRTGLTPISSLPSHQVLSDSSYEDNMTMRCTSCLRFRSEDRRKTNNKVCVYDQISKPSAPFFNSDDGLTCCSCVTGNTRQSPHQITSQNEKRQQCETNTQQKNEECGNHDCNGVTQIQKNMEKPRQIENEMKISSSFCNYKSRVPHPTKTGLNKEKVSLPSENKLLENNAAVEKRIPPTSTSPKNCTDRYSQACESRINERDDDSMLAITLNILRARSGKNVENIYSLETIEKLSNCYKSQSAINNNGSKTGDVLQEIDDFVSTIKLLSKDIERIEKQGFSTLDSSDSTQCTVNDSPVGCNTISTDITADSDISSKAISSKCFISSDSTQEALEQKFKDEDESCIRKPSDKSFSASSDVKIDVSYTNERNVNEGTTKRNENDKKRIQNLNTVPVSSNDNVCRNTVEDEQDIHQIINKIPGEDTSQVKTLEHTSSQALHKERKFANNSSELSNQFEEKNSEVSDITLLKDCNRESNEITLLISTDKVEKDPQYIHSTALSNTSMKNIVTNGPRDKGNETVDGSKISMNGENKLSDTLDNIDNSSARDDSSDISSTVKSNIILNQSDNTNATDNVIEAHQTLAKIMNIKGNSDDNEAECTLHSTGKITAEVDLHHTNNNSNESENSSPLHSPSKSRIARDSKDYIKNITTDSMKDGAPCTNLDPVQDIILNTKCDNTTERSSPAGLASPGKTKLCNDMDNVENDSTLEYISSASSAPEQTVILKYPCDDICKANNISESRIPRERFQDIQKNKTDNLSDNLKHIEPPIHPTSDACTSTLASHILQDDPQKTEKTPSKEATKEIQEIESPTHPTSDAYTDTLASHILQDDPQTTEKTPLKETAKEIQEIVSPTHPTSDAYTGTLASHILQDDPQKTEKTPLKEITKEIQEIESPTHPPSDAYTDTLASHILQDDPQTTEKTPLKEAAKEIQEIVSPTHPTSDAYTGTLASHILQDDPQKTEKTPLKEATKEIQEIESPTHPPSDAYTDTLASHILQDDPQKTEETPSKEATKEIQEIESPTHPTSDAYTDTLASHILQDDPQTTEKTPLKEAAKEIQEIVSPTHPTSDAYTGTLASHILQDDPQKTEKTPLKEITKEIQEIESPTHPPSDAYTDTLASHILQDDPQKTEKTPLKEAAKEIQEIESPTHPTSDAYTGTLASHILQDDPQKTEETPSKEATKEIQEIESPTHPTSDAYTVTLASHILQDDPQKTEETPSKEATKEIQEIKSPTHRTSDACRGTLASHILQDDPQTTEKTPLKEATKDLQEFVIHTHPTSDACRGTLASHILQDDPQKTEKTPLKEAAKEIQEIESPTHPTSDAYTGTLASHILQDDPQKTEETPSKEATKEIQEIESPTHPTSDAYTFTLASHILQDDPQKTEETPLKEATKDLQEFVIHTHPTSDACRGTLASHILQDDPQKTEKSPSKEAAKEIQEVESPTHPTSDAYTGTLASHILQDDPQKTEETPSKEATKEIQEIESPTDPTSDAYTVTLASHILQDHPQKTEETPSKEATKEIQEIESPTHRTSDACRGTLASHILQDDPQKTEETPSKEATKDLQEFVIHTHPTSDACTGTLASHILQDDPQKTEKTPLKEATKEIQEIVPPTHPTSDGYTGNLVSHISQDRPQKPEKTPLKEVRQGIQEIYSTESKYDVNLSQNVEIEAKEFPTEIMIDNTTKTSTTDNSDNVLITTESLYNNTYKNIELVMFDESVPRTSCQSLINDVISNEQDAIISNQETNSSVSERDLRLSSSNLNNPSSCDTPETCSSLHLHLFQNKKDDLPLNRVAAIGKGCCSSVCSDKMSCDGTHMSATGSGGFPESPVHIQDNITHALPEKYLDLSCYQNSKNVTPHRIENCFDNSSQTGKTTCDQQNLVEQLNVDPGFNTASTLYSDGGVESNINDVSISDATVHIGEIVGELSNDSEKQPTCSSLLNASADNEVIDSSPLKIQPVYLTHSALIPEHTATESSKEEVNINISEQNAKFLSPLQQKDSSNDYNTERINYNIQQQSTSKCNENGADGVREYSEGLFNKNYRTAEPAEFSSVSILETENYEVINGDNQQEKKSCIPGSANLHNEDERDSIGEYPKDGADQNISPNKHNVLAYDSTNCDLKFDSTNRYLASDLQVRNDLKVRQYFRCMRHIFDVSYNFDNADQDSDGSAKTNFMSRDGSGISPVISDHSVKKLTKSSENNLMSGNNIEMDTMMSNDNEDNKSCFRAAISSEFSAHNTSVVLNEKLLTLSNNSQKDKNEPKSDYENSINDNFNSTLHDRQRTFYYADKDNDEISNDKTVGETSVGNRRADELSRTVFVENNSNTTIAYEPSHSAQNTTELDRCRIVKHSGKIQSSSCSNSGTSSECAICTKNKVAVSVNNINETQLHFSEHGCSIYENSMEDTEMPSGYPPSHDASTSLCSTSKEFINSAEDVSIFASNPIISLKVSGENENYFDTANSTDILISNVEIVKDDAKISNSTFSERNDSSSMEHHVIDLSRGGSPISTEAQTSNSRGNTYENDTSLCQRSTIANNENEKLTGIPTLPLQVAASLQTADSISILNENTTKIKDVVNDQRVDSGNDILEHTGKESRSVNNKEIISNSNYENMGVDGVNNVFDPQIQDTMSIPKSVLCNEENIFKNPEDFTEKQSSTPMGVNNERNSTIRFDDDMSDSIIHHDDAHNVCMLSPKSFLPADTTMIESSDVGKNNSVYLDKTIMDTHLCSENTDKDVSTSSLEFPKNTVKYSSTTDSANPIQRSEKKKDRVVSCKSDTKPRKKSARKKSNGREPSSPPKNKALVDDNTSKRFKSGKKKKDSEVETSTTSHKKKYREHHHVSLLSKSKKLLKSKSKKCKSSTTLEDSKKCLSDTENKEYKDENNAMSLPPFKTQNAPQQTSSDTNHDSFPDERNVLLNCPSTSKNYQIENISVSDHDNESQSIIHNAGGYERLNDDSHGSASPSSKALKSNSNADCNERKQAKINRSIRRNDQYDNAIHKKHDSDYRKHPLYPLRMFLLSRSRRAFMNRLRSELSEDSATSVSKDLSANEPLEAENIHNKLNTTLTTEDPSIDQNNITESSVTNISATEKETDFNLLCDNVVNATNYGNVKTSVYECTQPSEVTNPNLEIENNNKISILDKSFQENLLNDEREDSNELTEKGSLNELSCGKKNTLNGSATKKQLCKNTHPFGIESHTSKPRDEQLPKPIDKRKLRISPFAADANMYSKKNCKEEGLSMIQRLETNEYSEEFTKTSLVPNTLPLAENPPLRTTTSSREGPVTAFPKRNHSSFINYTTEYVSDNTISWFNTESNSMETNDATHTKRHYANNLLEFSSTESDYRFKPLTETSDSQFHSSKNGVNSSFTGVGGQRKSYITRQNEIVKWSMDFETLHPPTPVFISDDSAFVESDFEHEIEEFSCYSSMVSKFNAEVCISRKHNASRIKNSIHGNDNTWSEKLDGTTRRSPVRECGAQTSDADGCRDGAECSTCAVCRQSAFSSTLVPVESMDVNDSFFQNSTDSPYEPGDENYTLFQVESHGNRNSKWGFVSERCKGCLRTKGVYKHQTLMSPSMSHETENSSDDENVSEDIWTLDRDGFRLRSFNMPSDPRLRSAWYMSRLQFYPKYCRPSPEVPWPKKLSEVEIIDDKLRHPDRSNLVDPMPRELKTDGKKKSSGGKEDMCIFEGVSDNHERRSSRQDPRIRSGQEIPIPQLPKTLKRYEPIYDRLARGEAAVELTFEVETARSQSAPPCVLRGRENHVRGAPQPQQRSCRRTASEVRRTPSPDASPPHTIFPIPTSSANPTQPSVTRPASAPSAAFLSSPGRASMPSLTPAPRPSQSPAARTSPRDPRLLHADATDVGGGKDGRSCIRRLTFDGSDASSRAGPADHGVIWRVNAHGDETVDPRIGSVARRWGTWLLRTGAEAHELREEAARTRGRGRLSGKRRRDVDTRRTKCADGQRQDEKLNLSSDELDSTLHTSPHALHAAHKDAEKRARNCGNDNVPVPNLNDSHSPNDPQFVHFQRNLSENSVALRCPQTERGVDISNKDVISSHSFSAADDDEVVMISPPYQEETQLSTENLTKRSRIGDSISYSKPRFLKLSQNGGSVKIKRAVEDKARSQVEAGNKVGDGKISSVIVAAMTGDTGLHSDKVRMERTDEGINQYEIAQMKRVETGRCTPNTATMKSSHELGNRFENVGMKKPDELRRRYEQMEMEKCDEGNNGSDTVEMENPDESRIRSVEVAKSADDIERSRCESMKMKRTDPRIVSLEKVVSRWDVKEKNYSGHVVRRCNEKERHCSSVPTTRWDVREKISYETTTVSTNVKEKNYSETITIQREYNRRLCHTEKRDNGGRFRPDSFALKRADDGRVTAVRGQTLLSQRNKEDSSFSSLVSNGSSNLTSCAGPTNEKSPLSPVELYLASLNKFRNTSPPGSCSSSSPLSRPCSPPGSPPPSFPSPSPPHSISTCRCGDSSENNTSPLGSCSQQKSTSSSLLEIPSNDSQIVNPSVSAANRTSVEIESNSDDGASSVMSLASVSPLRELSPPGDIPPLPKNPPPIPPPPPPTSPPPYPPPDLRKVFYE